MSGRLRDCAFQISYGPGDDRLNGFYLPALARSVRYDRSAGFFSSTALAVAAAGVARLIQNGGHMRLLVGAELDEDDVAAIARGHSAAERVTARLLARLRDADFADTLVRRRLEALAWMVAAGTLEIRVVLPTDADGRPLPAAQARDYYHPKEGVFTDAAGDQVAFSGSVNESETAWAHNYEQFMVYRSWDETRPYLAQVVRRFERLWHHQEPHWLALPIPEAVRERLVRLRPSEAPACDPLEGAPAAPRGGVLREGQGRYHASPANTAARAGAEAETAETRERLLVQFLRDAPYLPGAARLGAATAPVVPWPHQQRVADAVVARFPERFLIADEVGLGKTIEAGLALRQLLLAGRVRRCLILAPKSVLRQWQEELYEKVALDVPRFDGQTFWGVFGDERRPATDNPFDDVAVALASSQLMKRRDRQGQLLAAQPWDLVIVDEAHHARRRGFADGDEDAQPNRMLELVRALSERTRGLLLLTATPMQVHPVEMWDLLTLLGLGGRWGADAGHFLRFFGELRRDVAEVDWNFVLDMVRDYFATGGTLDAAFAAAAQRRIGLVAWQQVCGLPESSKREQVLRGLTDAERAVLVEFVKRHTPLRRLVVRNTRALLREYRQRGLLQATVPEREPRPEWIRMRPEERALYERVEEFIAEFYARYEARRRGLGFVMTVYRRRLTSSFAALARSLERRLAFLQGKADSLGLDDDDEEQDDLDQDVSEALAGIDRAWFREEIAYVEDFLRELGRLPGDSKLEHLLAQLGELFRRRETVVVFTQYTDTMDDLRERLRQVYGAQVACYSGRGGEVWRGGRWERIGKEAIKAAFRAGEVKVLVCTEAASEGLNLQTCGVLINYDMPWNPMRVEQRIGRVDRIGQRYPVVWIRNYFYEDTIEATIYQRLSDRIDWFQTVVGELQPILTQVARSIQTLAMLPGAERRRRLEAEIAALKQEIDHQQAATPRLDELLTGEPEAPAVAAPLTLADLERVLTGSPSLAGRFRPHPDIAGAYLLSWGDGVVAVTFDRAVFDEHPDTVRLLTYGDRLFAELLALVPAAAPSRDGRGVLRCAAEVAVPPLRACAYYRPMGTEATAVHRLAELERLVDPGPAVAGTPGRDGSAPLVWSEEARAAAEASFREDVGAALQRERALTEARQRAQWLALVERGRQVLLRAALVELARAQRGAAAETGGGPAAFSEAAVRDLRWHGYPFAPLLKLVDVTGVVPSAADPYFLDCQSASDAALTRRFTQLKVEAGALVQRLAAFRAPSAADPTAAPAVSVTATVLPVPDVPAADERPRDGTNQG